MRKFLWRSFILLLLNFFSLLTSSMKLCVKISNRTNESFLISQWTRNSSYSREEWKFDASSSNSKVVQAECGLILYCNDTKGWAVMVNCSIECWSKRDVTNGSNQWKCTLYVHPWKYSYAQLKYVSLGHWSQLVKRYRVIWWMKMLIHSLQEPQMFTPPIDGSLLLVDIFHVLLHFKWQGT